MSTAIKTTRAIQASTSNAAGATTTGTAADLRTALGGQLEIKITNGGTGPTAQCQAIVETSRDGSDWHEFTRLDGGTTASAVSSWSFAVDVGIQYLRVRFAGNTGQAVTVQAYLSELTSVG